jgi:hypothetical protein
LGGGDCLRREEETEWIDAIANPNKNPGVRGIHESDLAENANRSQDISLA